VALEPDALCACRILTALFKRDYIPHKIQPVAGYGDLSRAGEELVRPMQTTNGGSGGVVVCLGVGGLVDLGEILSLSNPEDDVEDMGGVEIWVFDARRPWNLGNVFGGQAGLNQPMEEIDANARRRGRGVDKGCITPSYTSKKGGIVVYDDGDIEEELHNEREAYYALLEMPEVDDDDADASDEGSDDEMQTGSKKRKSWSGREDDEDSEGDEPPHQRRRSNSVCISLLGIDLEYTDLSLGLFYNIISISSEKDRNQLVELIAICDPHIRLPVTTRNETALGSRFKETFTQTQEKTRLCFARVLFIWNVILRTNLVSGLFPRIRARKR
jgi:hypothetical protein